MAIGLFFLLVGSGAGWIFVITACSAMVVFCWLGARND
jgi:hypothetical protein